MTQLIKVMVFVVCFLWASSSWALEIYLKNGDKVTGVVVGEDSTYLLVQTLEAGAIKIKKSFIDRSKTYPQEYEPPKIQLQKKAVVVPTVEWKKDFALGYTQVGGNTKSQLGQLSYALNRKTSTNEITAKYDAFYSSSNGRMNGKKFDGLLRYAYSFGHDLKWYNFYKMEGDEDYFADIEYRLNPSTGVGYWFSDTDDFKAMTELGVGYQYTSYRIETSPDQGEAVLVPRAFMDKRLIAHLHITEDLTAYPSLANIHDYRVTSETALVNQITQRWSLKISYTDDFNSDPPVGFKKNDYIWLTSLEYHF